MTQYFILFLGFALSGASDSSSSESADCNAFSYNYITCSVDELRTSPLVGFDYRKGQAFDSNTCMNNKNPESGDCLTGVRRMAPFCESHRAYDTEDHWVGANFGPVFFPGGPGFGTEWPSDWAYACSYDSVINNVDWKIDYLCNLNGIGANSFDTDYDLWRTDCKLITLLEVEDSQTDFEFEWTDDACTNGIPRGDCMTFPKVFTNCGNDCEAGFYGPDDDIIGLKWKNEITSPLNDEGTAFLCPPGLALLEAGFLCGDFEVVNMQHTLCRFDQASATSNGVNEENVYGDLMVLESNEVYTKLGYRWDENDCTNGLPKAVVGTNSDSSDDSDNSDDEDTSCIAVVKSHRYCCNYSFNAKAVGPDEIVDGMQGPGFIVNIFEASFGDEQSSCGDFLDVDFHVDYLCGVRQ